VHRLVLPAVLPFAVDRQLGLAPRLGAHTPRSVGLVRSRKVPDGRPPEPVVRHARFTSFPIGPDAGSRPLSTLFERMPHPVHSRSTDPIYRSDPPTLGNVHPCMAR
jgi:hypothetical protein